MHFRQATLDDAPALAAISMEVWLGTYIRHGVTSEFARYALDTFTAEAFGALIAEPDNRVVVSENRDGPDGFARLAFGAPSPTDKTCTTELATLYVQPRHQGRGLGRGLLGAAIEVCEALQAPSVWVATNAENTPAIAFYLANGFIEQGETVFRIGAGAYPNTVFQRAL